MTKYFFDGDYNDFINLDNRKFRTFHPITAEIQSKRMECFLPAEKIQGKSILDLGCCVAAAGAWALANGAKRYVGVEIQKEYSELAEALLAKHFHDKDFSIRSEDFQEFLNGTDESFDIIVMTGVIYCVTDLFALLKAASLKCDEAIVMDSMSTKVDYNGLKVIEIVEDQRLNFGKTHLQHLVGIGLRPTPEALQFIMSSLGFDNGDPLRPAQVEGAQQDVYNDLSLFETRPATAARFAFRFNKLKDQVALPTLREVLTSNLDSTSKAHFHQPPTARDGSWEFDESIANRFQKEALAHIPDYRKVQDLCISIAKEKVSNTGRIIDVGSALGEMVDLFVQNGFDSAYGVECSDAMIKKSKQQHRIFHSNAMPRNQVWDLVVANWTLHFIDERAGYLQDVYNRLRPGGWLILTDKMDCEGNEEEEYLKFKLDNGLTQAEVENKRKAISGVLTTRPKSWYINTLSSIGFSQIETVNTRFMFNTLLCQKRH